MWLGRPGTFCDSAYLFTMSKKIFLVTGANSRPGRGCSLLLAQQGYHVLMLCRSAERGQAALGEICRQTGNSEVELSQADLSTQASIRNFANTFSQRFDQMNGLLSCAGIRVLDRRENEDGIELMFGTEYLGRFLLTNLSSHYPWFVCWFAAFRMARAKAVPPEIRAQDVTIALSTPELEGLTGRYFVEGREAQSSPESYDLEAARRFWEISEELVGQKFS